MGSRASSAIVVATAVAGLIAAPPVGAHEVAVVLVTPRLADGKSSRDAIDGFRLAVDQSPDVSHPAGEEGGDHLGGIDVALTLVQQRRADEAARRVARAVSAGARLVIVLPPADDAGEVLSRVRSARPLLIATGARRSLPARSAAPAILISQSRAPPRDRTRLERFERQFATRYARDPSRSALAGYDAARLLDRMLADLGEGLEGGPDLAAAVERAEPVLIGGSATFVSPAGADAPSTSPAADGSGRSTTSAVLLGVGTLAAAGAATLAMLVRRRRPRARGR